MHLSPCLMAPLKIMNSILCLPILMETILDSNLELHEEVILGKWSPSHAQINTQPAQPLLLAFLSQGLFFILKHWAQFPVMSKSKEQSTKTSISDETLLSRPLHLVISAEITY